MSWNHSLARNATTNAALGWLLVAVVLLTAVVSILDGALLKGVLALAAAGLLVVPSALRTDWRVVLPWPLGLVVAAGLVARSFGITPEVTGYLVIVEIDAFSRVEMIRRFAVLFALMTTIAFQTWWSTAQYYSDQWLGTTLIQSRTELQWDLVAVTAVSLVMSALFLWYFDCTEHVGSGRSPVIPEEAS